MAKRSIRKTDPTETTAPAKRRRTLAAETGEARPAVKAAPRRRKADTSAEPAPVAVAEIGATEVESTLDVTHEQIAVRAYHIYLERGYAGDQFEDWLTAERQLREQSVRARA
jgi:hypothetical protein